MRFFINWVFLYMRVNVFPTHLYVRKGECAKVRCCALQTEGQFTGFVCSLQKSMSQVQRASYDEALSHAPHGSLVLSQVHLMPCNACVCLFVCVDLVSGKVQLPSCHSIPFGFCVCFCTVAQEFKCVSKGSPFDVEILFLLYFRKYFQNLELFFY